MDQHPYWIIDSGKNKETIIICPINNYYIIY